jgi:hypothetical protein
MAGQTVTEGCALFKHVMALVLGSVGFLACAADGDVPAEGAADGEVFTETVVVFAEDGTETVHTREISRAEAMYPTLPDPDVEARGDEENVGEAAQALASATCSNLTLALYDQQYLQGNRICFQHYSASSQPVDLSTYCRAWTYTYVPGQGPKKICTAKWDGWVASFKAGNFGGYFSDIYATEAPFAAWQTNNDAWNTLPITSTRYLSAAGNIYCGNQVCDAGQETCSSCAADCGNCCGNGSCTDPGETCSSCAADCGTCIVCGNGQCQSGETCSNCPSDCGSCPPVCYNNVCETNKGETCSACPNDCGTKYTFCAYCPYTTHSVSKWTCVSYDDAYNQAQQQYSGCYISTIPC